jgi:hypothetical protein
MFLRRARVEGVRLRLKTRMLYRARLVFINGETIAVPPQARATLQLLADRRRLQQWRSRSAWLARTLYEWYRCGYVELGSR